MEINEIELNGQSLTFEDSVARTNIDKLNTDLIEARNEADVARRELDELRKHVAYADDSKLPTLAGQPSILFGHGTPQESVAPINWINIVDEDKYNPAGLKWRGVPIAIGQQYIDIDGEHKYIAYPSNYGDVAWLMLQ